MTIQVRLAIVATIAGVTSACCLPMMLPMLKGSHHGTAPPEEHQNHSDAVPAETEIVAFGEIMKDYEAIRVALLHDSTEQLPLHARNIERALSEVTARLGSTGEALQHDGLRALVSSARIAAGRLAVAPRIEEMRTEFASLSEPLIGWRDRLGGDRPDVVYCPVVRRAWLQFGDEVGNPYLGQSMAMCGQVRR